MLNLLHNIEKYKKASIEIRENEVRVYWDRLLIMFGFSIMTSDTVRLQKQLLMLTTPWLSEINVAHLDFNVDYIT